MALPMFDKIKEMVEDGSWGPEKAEEYGFSYALDKEIDLDCESLVLGAGPGGFGFVKSIIDSGQLVPNSEKPPIIILESGVKIGAKSVYGGAFWPNDPAIFEHDKDFFDDCPFDRKITKHKDNLHLINKNGKKFTPPLLEPATLFRNSSEGFMTPKSVLYPYFWEKLASKREEGFFKIRTSQAAEKLILNEKGAVVGCLMFTGQRYFAKVVIDATGNGALFSKHLATRSLNNKNGDFFFGVKLTCEMENSKINEIYQLKDNKEGCVIELAGNISDKVEALPGIVGIYPGDGVVNISILYSPDYGYKIGLQPHDIMNEVLKNPVVKKLTAGAKPVEWSACGLPELHFKFMPKWVADGYIPVGDTIGLVDFLRKHGVNTAMKSGSLAAETVASLISSKADMESKNLGKYKSALENSWIGKRMMSSTFKAIHHVIHMDLFYKTMVLNSSLGAKVKDVPEIGIPPMELTEYMSLNGEPKGQPEIIIGDLNICASCVSEACVTSDPCQAFSFNKSGIPNIDVDPVEREEIKNKQKKLSHFRMINAEGCLECSNCMNACPYENVKYSVPNHLKGKHNEKNQGIVYKYN